MTFALQTPLSDYDGTDVAVVVTVEWVGRTWYLSTRELTGEIHALPGLIERPGIDTEVSLSSVDAGASVSIAIVLPVVNVPSLVAEGHDIEELTAEVAIVWHRRGVLAHGWAARQVIAQGFATEPQHDDPTQPTGWIACTVEDSPYRSRRPIVRRTWEVTADTHAGAPEFGDRIPLVIGQPDPDGVGGGPPAPVINHSTGNADRVALSMGWASASTVYVVDADGAKERFEVDYIVDGLGQRTAFATVGLATVIDRTSTFTSAWMDGPALRPFGGSRPVHLAAHLLAAGGADIDLPTWVSVAELVGGSAGGYVDDPDTEPWEIARSILEGLPIRARRERDGWGAVIIDPAVASQLTVGVWREGGPYRRVSSWQSAGDNRVARVEVKSDVSELTVGATSARDAALPHAWARHLSHTSEASEGPAWSWKGDNDHRVAQFAARIGAFGWEASAWQVPVAYGQAREGDWLDLFEADGENRFALVQRRSLVDGIWDYTLVRPRAR